MTRWLAGALLAAAAPGGVALWDAARPLPPAAEIPQLEGVEFSVIKQREPEVDGFDWLHGVALVRHKGVLWTSWGHNKGLENTVTEIVQGRRSLDMGRTWEPVEPIAQGPEGTGKSHGVFLSHGGTLWALLPTFTGKYKGIRTEAYTLDEATGKWKPRGVVAGEGFWPLAEPVKMDDGNWLMAGAVIGELGNPGAVAVSRGADFTRWDVRAIPNPEKLEMWGETAAIVEGREVTAIVRYGAKALALVSFSKDFGRTWTPIAESNLQMTTSKPYAGKLSTGQRYLICTNAADTGKARSPLTIAVSRPGEKLFRKVYRIRDAIRPGENTTVRARMAYPYAVEYDGKLYVGYSVGRHPGNRNSAELAVIPVNKLKAD